MLFFDVGNSRIKCAEWLEGVWHNHRAVHYKKAKFSEQFKELLNGISPQPVYVACVVDEAQEVLMNWFQRHWSVQPEFVLTEKSLCGVRNGYSKAEQLGVDRWLAMVAAYVKYQSPVCVVDCGTAVTLDVVDGDGLHKGGLIIPGLWLMRDALYDNTSKINPATGELVELANNTQDAVVSGSSRLMVLGLDAICQQYLMIFSGMKIVLTGGDGDFFSKKMQSDTSYIDTLVMDGMRIAVTRNCQK